ncbi:Cation efflux protein [Venustampulla echinocandica]|uniref:Cation efflux protein n=1 Tax=Venustampulla echinocandica TaxID=2656787 RepID=A0A370TER9_9HELO|nr:Cation efflux protein [Venustampulla echinocandica]RDL33183.1 Cation efflux protein [Venustampulla echinocandica]
MGWSKSTRIKVMLGIDTAFFILELGVGLVVGSLALMADAFHMLNDIISLVVGLWAVTAARKSSTDKYSFGWLRAEILGAFFNAVFLIALCLTIVLEAVTRLIDPPEISNPKLILIVGSLGLASNFVGFLVLGGHGHSHGPAEHDHAHGDEVTAAEEGHSHAGEPLYRTSDDTQEPVESNIGEVFPEAVLAKAKARSSHIRFTSSHEHGSGSKVASSLRKSMSASPSPRKHRRRTNSRVRNIDDISIHPSSFRQDILAVTRPQPSETESEDSSTGAEDDAVLEDGGTPTETAPLLSKSNGKSNGATDYSHNHEHRQRLTGRPRHDSWHATHNHNKPKKRSKGGHGHSHSDMGMNAMVLHVIGDALGNVGVIASALIIWLSSWSGRYYADPAVSLFIALIILNSTVPLTSATAKVLLQATPDHIDVTDIKEDIQSIPGVVSCHHVHIWQLSDTQVVASMHIQVAFPISEAAGEKYMEVARAARKCLHAYGVHSATIQPEFCTDKAHDHVIEGGVVGLDGIVGQQRCGLDDDACLLECIDDCTKGGCCPPSQSGSQNGHEHSDHEGHSH